jgi:hypothetical protein
MSYDFRLLFETVSASLHEKPRQTLREISDKLRVSDRTIEKAVHTITGRSFKCYRETVFLSEIGRLFVAQPNVPIKVVSSTPHRNILTDVKLSIVPSVAACLPNCTGYESKEFCGLTNCETKCQSGSCWCPGCSRQPGCTNYCCQYTGNNTICSSAFGKTPCEACELDSSSGNCAAP